MVHIFTIILPFNLYCYNNTTVVKIEPSGKASHIKDQVNLRLTTSKETCLKRSVPPSAFPVLAISYDVGVDPLVT